MGEYLAQGRTTRYLSAMDPPKAVHVKPDKPVWRPPKHTPVTTYISAVAAKKETSAENHKPKPPRPPHPWLIRLGAANQYSATARVHTLKDVSDAFLRWAHNRKRRKLRVFQQTVTIIPTTVKIGDPKDTTTHRLVDGFLVFGISEFMIVDTVPMLQELAKEFPVALGQKYVEAHYLDKGFFVQDERPVPTEQRVTWPKFLTCTLHMATGQRVQTLPGNLKDLRGPVGEACTRMLFNA